MAVPKTLTSRIQAVINSIQEMNRTQIKAKLSRLAPLVKALEGGSAARKAKAKIARLETALENSDANYEQANAALEQSSAEIGNLRSELQTLQAEVAKYQAERKKEEKREGEIAPIQFQILKRLPSPSGTDWLRSDEIARALKIRLDEADAYIDGLKRLGFVIFHHHDPGGGGWRRTASGNTLVLAKRRAGDPEAQEEKPKAKRKYADLSTNEHIALLMIAKSGDEGITANEIAKRIGGGATVNMINLMLVLLEEKKMVGDGDEPDYGAGRYWTLRRNGSEYLAERGQL